LWSCCVVVVKLLCCGCEVVVLWLNCVRGGRCVPPYVLPGGLSYQSHGVKCRDMDPHPVPYRYSDSVIWIVTKKLFVDCQPSLEISCKSVRKFLRSGKVANKQTDKQINNDDCILYAYPPWRRYR